jgi:D-tyrosyl-tRNA(Tyr) deacylase
VNQEVVGRIDHGLTILLGVARGDGDKQAAWLAKKIAGLRIFEDDEGKMNLSLLDVGGSALVVSQFTLYGDCTKGRRPSFIGAAPPEEADRLYRVFCERLAQEGCPVETGRFQTTMSVELINEGPVTLILETPE